MAKEDKVLGPGAAGEVGDVWTDQSTIQPGLLEGADEKAGRTPEEQAAAEQKLAAKIEKEQSDGGS